MDALCVAPLGLPLKLKVIHGNRKCNFSIYCVGLYSVHKFNKARHAFLTCSRPFSVWLDEKGVFNSDFSHWIYRTDNICMIFLLFLCWVISWKGGNNDSLLDVLFCAYSNFNHWNECCNLRMIKSYINNNCSNVAWPFLKDILLLMCTLRLRIRCKPSDLALSPAAASWSNQEKWRNKMNYLFVVILLATNLVNWRGSNFLWLNYWTQKSSQRVCPMNAFFLIFQFIFYSQH